VSNSAIHNLQRNIYTPSVNLNETEQENIFSRRNNLQKEILTTLNYSNRSVT